MLYFNIIALHNEIAQVSWDGISDIQKCTFFKVWIVEQGTKVKFTQLVAHGRLI